MEITVDYILELLQKVAKDLAYLVNNTSPFFLIVLGLIFILIAKASDTAKILGYVLILFGLVRIFLGI
jgi:hypothetical protein